MDEITSDDETDHGEGYDSGGYLVLVVFWRSDEFNRFIMNIDDLSVLHRYKPNKVRGPGAAGRLRIRIACFGGGSTSEIPFDLPRNCYNSEWVDSLDTETRADFESQCGEPMSLAFDADVLK